MADLGDPIRVIEIQPLEVPVPSELPVPEPEHEHEHEHEHEDVPAEVDR